MNKETVVKIKTLLKNGKKISILTHKNPDGDAIGSSLALYHYLKKYNHQVRVIVPNAYPDFLGWMPEVDKVINYERSVKNITQSNIINSDIIFLLDFNTLSRIEPISEYVEKNQGVTILIDHHQQPDTFDYVFSDTSMPATAQMIYHFIEALDDEKAIDKTIAECLYTGIMTDTGSFRYANTSPTTHNVLAKLLEKGASNATIHSSVYDSSTISKIKVLSKALEHLTVIEKLPVSYIYLSANDLKECNYKKGDTEGIVNYGLSLKDIELTALFIEDEEQGIVKISFRSKTYFDTNQFARTYFEGGGHINASGGRSHASLQKTIEQFVYVITTIKNQFNV